MSAPFAPCPECGGSGVVYEMDEESRCPIRLPVRCEACDGLGDVLCGYCPERRVATTEIDPGCPACEECRRESDADNQLQEAA